MNKNIDILTEEGCKACIRTRWIGKNLIIYDKTDSTNTRLKEAAKNNEPSGMVAIADEQEAGKGRLGRSWSTPKGDTLAFSILLRPDLLPEKASMLTLVTAIAAKRALKRIAGTAVQIKWPNDLVYKGKKLCGILTEMSVRNNYIDYVIVGIGINVKTVDFPEEIKETATSIKLITKQNVQRTELLAALLEEFEILYEEFTHMQNLSWIKQEYEASLANKNKRVRVLDPLGEWMGQCIGIKDDGALLIRTDDNVIKEVISGEVSVRGIYGYTD